MATYLFAMPIQPGKTEAMKKYAQEMNGPRQEEFRKRNQRLGLETVQVWLQHTPDGDMAVVRWETDNPRRAFEQMMKSEDPFDKWFKEKLLVEVFGRNPSDPIPQLNEQIVDYQGQPTGKKTYEESKKR
jgi:hypothetical protein